MKKTILHILATMHRPGTWVILNPEMTDVLGAGRTLKVAMRKAGIPTTIQPAKAGSSNKRPVAMQVLDPKMKFF